VKTRNAGISRNTADITEYGGISRNMAEYHGIWRNITEYGGISRNMAEHHGISRNMAEFHGISRYFPGIYRNITIFYDGSRATVYKHGRLETYYITKVIDLSDFDGKYITNNNSILEVLNVVYIILRVFTKNFESI
jgi:hypothetical protein